MNNSDLRMQAFLFIYNLISLDQLYAVGPLSPHALPSLPHFTLFYPTFLSAPAPQDFSFVVVLLGAGRVESSYWGFSSPPSSPQTGLHPTSLSAGFQEKKEERQEDEEEEEGKGKTVFLGPWHLGYLHIS